MRREEILSEIGFSRNESKVYLTLLQIGPSTAGTIAARSNIHRTNVYDAVERLAEKGIVTHIFKGNKKYFEAVDPNHIKEVLNDRSLQFETNVLPSLMLDYKKSKVVLMQLVVRWLVLAVWKELLDSNLEEGKVWKKERGRKLKVKVGRLVVNLRLMDMSQLTHYA